MKRLLSKYIYSLLLLASFAGVSSAQSNNGEFQSPQTASYYLAPVASSGIDGNLQLSQIIDLGTKAVVTLQGIDETSLYELILYHGDCGPDREEEAKLTPVGQFSNDPYVSITELPIPFEQLSGGNYFLYVLEDSQVLACGEVGQGANAGS